MLISQIKGANGEIIVAVREPGGDAKSVKNAVSVYALAMEAADGGKSLASVIEAHGYGDAVDLEKAYAEGRFLPPIT
ncbi:GguC protein, partial [Rhizobium ruizarguesonis]